jgi:hypothetical protein
MKLNYQPNIKRWNKKMNKKKKVNLVNMPMDFLKFKRVFFPKLFFYYIVKRKTNDHIIELN